MSRKEVWFVMSRKYAEIDLLLKDTAQLRTALTVIRQWSSHGVVTNLDPHEMRELCKAIKDKCDEALK